MGRSHLVLLIVLTLCGCGAGSRDATVRLPRTAPSVGPTAKHRPPSLGQRAARAVPIGGLRCSASTGSRFGAHLELFASKHVVLVQPGIGIAPPRTQHGAYLNSGRCSYPLRTREPTGVVEVRGTHTLGDFFSVWGQRLGRHVMAGFRGRVRAYLNGRPWRGPPSRIPLTRHAQIVVEVGAYVKPHPTYRFPPGL